MPPEAPPIRLLIVDDHEIVRGGLRALFKPLADIEVVGEADTMAKAIAETSRLKPAVVLMDLRLPDGSGVEACREILAENDAVRVLFLTSFEDEEAMLSAVFSGAAGFLLKEIAGTALVQAVRSVASGQSILDASVAKLVRERLKAESQADQPAARLSLISPQERRVLALVAEGRSNKEIAAALQLSDKTVKNYLSHIFEKLRVSRRGEAAALYLRDPRR